MKLNRRTLTAGVSAMAFFCACTGGTELPRVEQKVAKDVKVAVVNDATDPFVAGAQRLGFLDDGGLVVATSTGIAVLDASSGNQRDSLPLSPMTPGLKASAIAVAPTAALGGRQVAFFHPSSSNQIGAVEISSEGSKLVGEALLTKELTSTFPVGLVAPKFGPASAALWVGDAPFGEGSAVRAYTYGPFISGEILAEDEQRRLELEPMELAGDGELHTLVLAGLSFTDDGRYGLASFTVLGGTAIGAAGGVIAFNPETGEALGSFVVPNADTSSTTSGFVGAVATDAEHVFVTVAEKGPNFEERGGQLAVYKVSSWDPFRVVDDDINLIYDQPSEQLPTSDDNPVAVTVIGPVALVVDAPFFLPGTLDEFLIGETSTLRASHSLGMLYTDGFSVPSAPAANAAKTEALIGTEPGVLRLTTELVY